RQQALLARLGGQPHRPGNVAQVARSELALQQRRLALQAEHQPRQILLLGPRNATQLTLQVGAVALRGLCVADDGGGSQGPDGLAGVPIGKGGPQELVGTGGKEAWSGVRAQRETPRPARRLVLALRRAQAEPRLANELESRVHLVREVVSVVCVEPRG